MGHRTRRAATLAVVAGLLAAGSGARTAAATGQILLAGAAIDSGASPVAKGPVVIDTTARDVAPPADPDPVVPIDLGTPPDPPPAFPADLPGGAPFHATADATLADGTLDASSFAVDEGVTVTFTGAVEIRTTGDVTLGGLVRTTAADASIRFLCGGDFTVDRPKTPQSAIVSASGARADVTIDVAGAVAIDGYSGTQQGFHRTVHARRDVRIVQHDPVGSARLRNVVLEAESGSVDVLAASTFDSLRADVAAPHGTASVRTFTGTLDFDMSTIVADGLTFDSATGVDAFIVDWTIDGPVSVGAHALGVNLGGDVVVQPNGAPAGAARADFTVSGRGVALRYGTVRHAGRGDIVLRAPSAVSTLLGTDPKPEHVVHDGTGDIVFRCARTKVRRQSLVRAAHGDVRVERVIDANSFTVEGASRIEVPEGSLRAAAADFAMVAGTDDAGFGPPTCAAFAMDVDSPGGTVDVEAESIVCGAGGLRMVLRGPATLRGPVASKGPVAITSTHDLLDLAGASVTTTDETSATGRITIQTETAGAAVIDLTGATVRSGNSASGASGAVVVATRGPGNSGAAAPVDGCVVVESARVRHDRRHPENSALSVSGSLDLGVADVDLAGACTLTANAEARNADLAADAAGAYRFANPAFALAIVPSSTGSSRARFSLTRTGDTSPFVDDHGAGALDLRFQAAGLDAAGMVRLAHDRFRRGAPAGAVLRPQLAPLAVEARLKGDGKDTLTATFSFAPEEDPAVVPTVSFAFGDVLAFDVAAAAFRQKRPGVFTATRPAVGIASLVVDRNLGTVSVRARRTELGALAAGRRVDVQVAFGDDVRTLRMRLGGKASKLAW